MKLIERVILEFEFNKTYAEAIIRSGNVFVNDEMVFIPSLKLKKNDSISIKGIKKYVSRGAYKLEKALSSFPIKIENKTCLDIGSSTGGFTQILLEKDAKKVFAVDVGSNQLDWKIRNNKKVISLENKNIKYLTNKDLENQKIDIIVCDVSFISIKRVFDKINELFDHDVDVIILIKPQYESPSNIVEKGGFVDEKHHENIINDVIFYAQQYNFKKIDIIDSPIRGQKSKNKEYLSWFKKEV